MSEIQPGGVRRPARSGPRILVVDSNKSNLGVLARRLGDEGYRIAAAESAEAAVAELGRSPVELVLAELAMPGMSGVELVRMIRDEVNWRDLPVILISARSEPDGAVRALAAGADDVVIKPFHFEVLSARIARQLARARSVKALRDDNAALDARVVTRAIELGEMRQRWVNSETERRRLAELVPPAR
jgi:DNA-binding response OmpR family regulator